MVDLSENKPGSPPRGRGNKPRSPPDESRAASPCPPADTEAQIPKRGAPAGHLAWGGSTLTPPPRSAPAAPPR
eukprot:CAMPEP_0113707362 /NCGR_PEP_ID=MMETSP0038_2-20120614/28331_1 /TAXON_ID=2898 /ORGANISM="Cryptomonas paramecium" /LENGTH=72 /DNA_ID=CAMNT_0000632843 /DNA_START=235 /DNA_END=450 /DNA_ORIENTATION=+ /assembly_acc=CAM_ASM_000170